MVQANSGMYRVQDSYLEACQKQDAALPRGVGGAGAAAAAGADGEWQAFDYTCS